EGRPAVLPGAPGTLFAVKDHEVRSGFQAPPAQKIPGRQASLSGTDYHDLNVAFHTLVNAPCRATIPPRAGQGSCAETGLVRSDRAYGPPCARRTVAPNQAADRMSKRGSNGVPGRLRSRAAPAGDR